MTTTELRDAIREGNARVEDTTERDGRPVVRIRIDGPTNCPVPGCEEDPWYMYVDPDTFYPVRMESPHGYLRTFEGIARFSTVQQYVTFQYLPRTAANAALADIRTQHPNAR